MNELKNSNLQSLFSSIASLTRANNDVDTHISSAFFSLTHTLILHRVLIPCEPISEWPSVTIEYAKDPSSSFQASLSRIANAFHLLQTWHFQNVVHISLTASSRCKQIRTTACNPIIPNTVNYTSARENPSSGHCKWPLIAFTWQLSLPENVLGAPSKLNHALSVPRVVLPHGVVWNEWLFVLQMAPRCQTPLPRVSFPRFLWLGAFGHVSSDRSIAHAV